MTITENRGDNTSRIAVSPENGYDGEYITHTGGVEITYEFIPQIEVDAVDGYLRIRRLFLAADGLARA
ncbi:hypothetical protein J6TS7_53670 [Paenibacillus dendritiformis]|nr:hypothetical protein J6TS7_53670 [Paenibacillus dendritiformis]